MDDGGRADIVGGKERWSCADLALAVFARAGRNAGGRRSTSGRHNSRVCLRKQFAVTISSRRTWARLLLLTKHRPPPCPLPFVLPAPAARPGVAAATGHRTRGHSGRFPPLPVTTVSRPLLPRQHRAARTFDSSLLCRGGHGRWSSAANNVSVARRSDRNRGIRASPANPVEHGVDRPSPALSPRSVLLRSWS